MASGHFEMPCHPNDHFNPVDGHGDCCNVFQTVLVRQGRGRSGIFQNNQPPSHLVTTFDGNDTDRLPTTKPDGTPAIGTHISVYFAPPMQNPIEAKTINAQVPVNICLKYSVSDILSSLGPQGIQM
mgnify:CR=1 FL=1